MFSDYDDVLVFYPTLKPCRNQRRGSSQQTFVAYIDEVTALTNIPLYGHVAV
ncbi:hypothetical protein P4S64_07000 [Vibrio sp. M60_M31a]